MNTVLTPRSRVVARILAVVLLACAAGVASAADALRPEVGKPLQAAQELLKSKKYSEAMTRVSEAEKIPNLTPYESYIIARMRAASALGLGDYKAAANAYYAVLASGRLPEAEKLPTMEALVRLSYSAREYPKAIEAIQRYRGAGGANAEVIGLLPQALYIQQRYAEAARELTAQIVAGEQAGKAPSETQLQLLGSCALKQNDNAGYLAALERLVTYYPKQTYWLDVVLRTASRPGFSDRMSLDTYRLRSATGTMDEANDFIEATQL
ncbi:MAG: tetratricopeptide repeat protein, partial [Nevskiales bacterium]